MITPGVYLTTFRMLSRFGVRFKQVKRCAGGALRVKITDENGDQIYTNWPKPFGAGVYEKGEKAGFPIMEDSRELGAYRNMGRVTTFRTTHRWPRPTETMPLRKKLEKPPKWEDAYKSFAHQSDPIAFPKPGEKKPSPNFQ